MSDKKDEKAAGSSAAGLLGLAALAVAGVAGAAKLMSGPSHTSGPNFHIFAHCLSATFTPPAGVKRVRVLVVGGGAAGEPSQGGGSGFVVVRTDYPVGGPVQTQAILGTGMISTAGSESIFGDVVADPGQPPGALSFSGGKGGSNGGRKQGGQNGEPGQGKWPDFASIFRYNAVRAGIGGKDGGGGGGVSISIAGFNTLRDDSIGEGCGAGGGDQGRAGCVYVEWDTLDTSTPTSPTLTPAPAPLPKPAPAPAPAPAYNAYTAPAPAKAPLYPQQTAPLPAAQPAPAVSLPPVPAPYHWSPTATLCAYCKTRPGWREPTTGLYYPFCSQSCKDITVSSGSGMGAAAPAKLASPAPAPAAGYCAVCKTRPVYVDPVRGPSLYCSRSCMSVAAATPPPVQAAPAPVPAASWSAPTPQAQALAAFAPASVNPWPSPSPAAATPLNSWPSPAPSPAAQQQTPLPVFNSAPSAAVPQAAVPTAVPAPTPAASPPVDEKSGYLSSAKSWLVGKLFDSSSTSAPTTPAPGSQPQPAPVLAAAVVANPVSPTAAPTPAPLPSATATPTPTPLVAALAPVPVPAAAAPQPAPAPLSPSSSASAVSPLAAIFTQLALTDYLPAFDLERYLPKDLPHIPTTELVRLIPHAGPRQRLERWIQQQAAAMTWSSATPAAASTPTPFVAPVAIPVADAKADTPTSAPAVASFISQFHGDFELPVPKSQLIQQGSQVFAVDLDSKNSTHAAALARLYADLGSQASRITRAQVVFNPARYRIFLGEMETAERRMTQPAFQPHFDEESDPKLRQSMLAHLHSLCAKVNCNRNVKMLRVWHGTSAPVAKIVVEDGFAAIAKLDAGWFGKGIYFSTNPAYAERYCNKPRCLIMCYVILVNPYPIVASDAPADKDPEDFAHYGKGNYKNYQSHYVRVAPVDPEPTLDYRPPADPTSCTRDEVVIFQEGYILPQMVVHLGDVSASVTAAG